ncbi:MAG: hypothetical protein KGR98_03195 [Verrucomicrobia bacterium]|nr:hypothetical protein [Verrucomicrobiota bacterium]MDE3099767.1 hypothetical protein [Verrucomicrobiota bacterium]
MMEIAISLAVIGIALVAILGVLPLGLRMQRDNRERTVIAQDATVFMSDMSKGLQGADDLTNYVFAITNYWFSTNPVDRTGNAGVDGYGFQGSQITSVGASMGPPQEYPITNGLRIIGLMDTPVYTDTNGAPISAAEFALGGGRSNYVVADVYSLSGPAVEKPPQNNPLAVQSGLGYQIVCRNSPVAPPWQARGPEPSYPPGAIIPDILNGRETYWRWEGTNWSLGKAPPASPWFQLLGFYPSQLSADLHNLQLVFYWPLLPNGQLPPAPISQSYNTLVAGELVQTAYPVGSVSNLYFFAPQIFTNAP